jgi:hypothetical protein
MHEGIVGEGITPSPFIMYGSSCASLNIYMMCVCIPLIRYGS